ncbi:DUF6656 family protein [Rhizobium mongolense]|jgi:hypothetical protein|uniref:Uncharacterized protein n=2 Tax=Rhizobium mongolense TaxID=57676 RepID=A0A7W6RSX0_9HYPH|nr:DUF6656 family protein [Rhizobium mongolense]MBB4230736.1 hypothetical protein [Rhizobium mongolense]MBB4278022.1 hypothetical protein [Rhizobium mongolense]TVZ65894.1 hypothetical protein BCL32_6235 [Rhizobium mongolense USDA 1844]
MSAVSKLQYGERFGEEVTKIARASLSVASTSSDAEVATTKYSRWFHGENAAPEPMATSRRKFKTITANMAAAEVAAATKENLSILGDDASDLFTSKLPAGHKLRKTIRSSLLPGIPYLGSCKFGEIVTDRGQDRYAVTQMFIANFDGDLDTSEGANFYKPVNRDFGQMFYGVHIIVDRFGNPLGFDRDRGDNGIAFKTKDVTKALYSIASASTGLSIEALLARAAGARKAAR